jgi:hypothetical protein
MKFPILYYIRDLHPLLTYIRVVEILAPTHLNSAIAPWECQLEIPAETSTFVSDMTICWQIINNGQMSLRDTRTDNALIWTQDIQ